jgi:hypothetical protein
MKDTFYTCPYCNEEYNSPVDLAHCILSCEEKKRVEEEKKQKEKLEAEKEVRKKEIEAAEKHYHELIKSYIKDYGSYSAIRKCKCDEDDITSVLKPWEWLFGI